MNLDAAILSVLIPAIVSIVLGFVQYTINRRQVKSAETKDLNVFIGELLDKARELNKQELDTVRIINDDLKKQIEVLTKENLELRRENEVIKRRLSACEKALSKVFPECDVNLEEE